MIGRILALSTRILTGGTARWNGCLPEKRQRIYFANHTSNLDSVLLWSALPTALRRSTRPVGAVDYWSTSVRGYFARHVFNAVLIERKRVTRANNPLKPMLEALAAGDSLIIFPEGTRLPGGEIGAFQPGLHHLAAARPEVELIPVYIDNLNRVLPKGEVLPVPMLCSVHFGEPVPFDPAESKCAFLHRARTALGNLRPS
jgi:1-acyl-sn-glycerol-3-phosphate acyltransferase